MVLQAHCSRFLPMFQSPLIDFSDHGDSAVCQAANKEKIQNLCSSRLDPVPLQRQSFE